MEMDRDNIRKNFARDLESQDTYDTRQAKQRASIKWLLSKAYNNRVPDNLKEPFYKDHEDQEHVKPQIVHNLANAELYCLALANIYSDPNYHSLNHGGILQTMSRKGVAIPDSTLDGPLTETVLIKTAPIKLAAHITVIEAMMELYTKEVVTPDRVVAAVQRFTHGSVSPAQPVDAEGGLLQWVNHAQTALSRRIEMEGVQDAPRFPSIRDVKGLSDGAGLAALISFYCPDELPWREIKIPVLPTISDSVHNLCLVHEFSHHSLPASVCHMMPEDVTYLHSNMRMNLLVLLADLFNVLEIHPVKCVRFPGREPSVVRNSQGVIHKRSLPLPVTGIPDLRSNLSSHSSFTVSKISGNAGLRKSYSTSCSESNFAGSPDSLDTRYFEEKRGDDFIVHRNRTVPTLSSMLAEDPLIPARLRPNKERGNQDSKVEERGELGRAAGKPTNYDDTKRCTFAGRRSRRNSLSDDSQLTLENFGGSQENLHFLGRNPDKDPAVLLSSPAATATRTSAQEARSTGIELIFSCDDQPSSPVQRRDSRKSPSPVPPMATPSPSVPIRSSQQDARSNAIARIFADNGYGLEKSDEAEKPPKEPNVLPNPSNPNAVTLNSVLQHSKQLDYTDGEISSMSPLRQDHVNSTYNRSNGNGEKKASFAASPNTTTWQQQQRTTSSTTDIQQAPTTPVSDENNSSSLQLHNIRLKLEEKRRVIENEKKRIEVVVNKQRQKLGKAAFLQAVTKDIMEHPVERKWIDSRSPFVEERKTPDMEHVDLEHYQKSILQMDNSLSEIDSDMQRLRFEEKQLLVDDRMGHHFKDYSSQPSNKLSTIASSKQKLQTLTSPNPPHTYLSGRQNEYSNQSYLAARHSEQPSNLCTTFVSSSPPTKPLSLSQLHHQNIQQPTSQQFFLHEQPRRTTWREQSDQSHGGFSLHETRLANGAPTPSPRSVTASPQHKPAVPPRQTQPRQTPAYPSPLPAPSFDDMAPQSICFLGDSEDDDAVNRTHINISSGSRTYRIPSPTRPYAKNPFLHKPPSDPEPEAEKGFYISFDDETPPKRPKPPLRGKRNSPKKDRFATQVIETANEDMKNLQEIAVKDVASACQATLKPYYSPDQRTSVSGITAVNYTPDANHRSSGSATTSIRASAETNQRSAGVNYTPDSSPRPAEPLSPGVGLVIGTEADPNTIDEMEKKKEKILMLSLQRRQQQEESKARKENEAQQRRDIEKLKEEDRARKKEEERARRNAIFEQYKLKKAIEEAEREGKVIDKADLLKLAAPKMRSKATTTPRPRPKTIHVERGGDFESGMLAASRGNIGSSNNLAERSHESSVFSRPLRRDQYRGSQDSLANSRGRLRESPSDDGRGVSPLRGGGSNLGRRGSYKTSRDTSEPPQNRSRSKYSTYQPIFRNRKSNSLVNLSGSSTDQDSLAYRCGDTDSGLGRATPPRRAPSPGFGRHLTSPSGPGSLPPGLISKRRVFDDGASDVSSNASSMMDYNGPRLYKQPATKSNRGIMLNAVEYCVFPGVVNKEQKRRVLEEISRSEAKHFLILFRDAGCQFRALYSYCPDTEEVIKLYGTGPRQVNDRMFDKFFKYNSGGKCFSQVHTKHLTVTIDAFTIHNSLWQGKKVNLPSKKDMALVI